MDLASHLTVDLASLPVVDLALHVVLDLAILRVGRGVLHTGHEGITKEYNVL